MKSSLFRYPVTFLLILVSLLSLIFIFYGNESKDENCKVTIEKMFVSLDRSSDERLQSIQSMTYRSVNNETFLGHFAQDIWIKAVVKNRAHRKTNAVIKFLAPNVEHISMYDFKSNKTLYAGSTVERDQRDILSRIPAFNIDLAANEVRTIFFKVNTRHAAIVNISIVGRDYFDKTISMEFCFFGLIVGVLVAMIYSNLINYCSVRRKFQLYYIFFSILSLLFLSVISGYADMILLQGGHGLTKLLSIFYMLYVILKLLFVNNFLDLKMISPKTSSLISKICYGIVFMIPFVLIIPVWVELIFDVLSLSFIIFSLYIGIISYRDRSLVSKYYILAWIIATLFQSVILFAYSGFISITFKLEAISYILMTTELFVFSMLIGYRIRRIDVERRVALVKSDKVEAFKEVVYQFGHDLLTPINVIIGHSKNLAKVEGQLNSGVFGDIYNKSLIVKDSINHVRKIAIIKADKHKFAVEEINLKNAFSDALKCCRSKAKLKEIRFTITDDHTVSEHLIFAEYEKLVNNIFIPIIDNAVKFSFRGGQIFINFKLLKGRVNIIIRDYGVGINSDVLKNIDKYWILKGSHGTEQEEKGNGFSLPLAFSCIGYFNGTLKIKSSQNIMENGTSVTLNFKIK